MVIVVVSVLGLVLGALAGRAGAHLYAPHSTAELLLVAIPCCLGEIFLIEKLIKRFDRLALLDKLRLDDEPFGFFSVAFFAAWYMVNN
ncbi:MAG: hypothetical protein IKU14_01410 [Rhodocyclaceae bacterium]|nr:hypothetical protein [Rhodocyclaceae bacterium]